MTVAFAVTEAGENAVAGDYFTAAELGDALRKCGINVKYLTQQGQEGSWYDVGKDTDVVISMLQHYDPRQIQNESSGLVTVAWARNWFDEWVSRDYFAEYDMILASSKSACEYMQKQISKPVHLFPIATNYEHFHGISEKRASLRERFHYQCDYCFTGNWFGVEREIQRELRPEKIGYRFKLYGANWEGVERFGAYTMGHLSYQLIPMAYKHTKLVLDDATPSTKELGALNSRIYDAIAAGCLVATNNVHGAEETFRGILPSFQDEESCTELVRMYLKDRKKRERKIQELQDFVSQNHTYDIRAKELMRLLSGR